MKRWTAVQIKQYFKQIRMAIVLITMILIIGCGDEISPGTTPSTPSAVVKTAISVAEIVQQPAFYEAAGTVFSQMAATVSAKVMGEIRKVLVQEGDTVAAGEPLVVIDDSQLSAYLQQAKAALAAATQGTDAARAASESVRAASVLAEKTLHRYEDLLESESVSQQEFDEVMARYEQAIGGLSQAKAMHTASQKQVDQAKAGLLAAKSIYADTTVTAPYDGTVTGKLVDEGDLAAPGVPLIRLESSGLSEVHIVVPESYIRQVHVGDHLSVFIPSLLKSVFTGEIKIINSAADSSTRSFLVKVGLPEIPDIQAGMFAKVLVPIGETSMIQVPETAVKHHGQLSGVYIVDADSIAHFRLIRPGRMFGDHMEVLSGIQVGGRYVTKPDHTIVDGVKVEES